MNKNDLITFLRNPNELKESDLAEIEKILASSPYFLCGRMLLAKGSKEIKHPDTRKRVSSAAVYSTDRPLLKKYISGKLFFLSKPPEKEELTEEPPKQAPQKKSEPKKETEKSKKIEILDTPKIEKESQKKEVEPSIKTKESSQRTTLSKSEDSDLQKPRREPRFDPSATASFKRRWDVKGVSEDAPKSKESEKKATDKPLFVGKKVDRSNRVRKKSMRDELINEVSPKNLIKKEEPKVEKKLQVEPKKTPTTPPKEIEKDIPKTSTEVVTKQPRPTPPTSSKTTEEPLEKKTVLPKKAPPAATEKPKVVEKIAQRSAAPKPAARPSPPVIRETPEKPALAIPDVPNEGIDAILEELERDMVNLKSSRSKFVEVQQKIEEDDAVSAALERATSKLPPKAKSEPEVEEAKKVEETPSPLQEEVKTQEEIKSMDVPVVEESKPKKDKETAKEKPKAKKATATKKKPIKKKESATKKTTTKKETISKKATPKKVVKKKAAPKAKSTKAKSAKNVEKEDDNKKSKKKADQNNIIDKFIADTPSIKYQKKNEPVDNEDLSDVSTEWNKELASEYLAEIYLHQGNKKRAIEIYTALSLKFPEKKSYFADLISKTK